MPVRLFPNPCEFQFHIGRLVSIFVAVTVVSVTPASAQLPGADVHEQLMERKLEAVQRVVEGLARGDFERIAIESQKLDLLSREAGWNVLATPTYLRLSEDFRSTVQQLKHASESGNLDAAALAYVKLSISCIDCHRYARKEMPRVGTRWLQPGDKMPQRK